MRTCMRVLTSNHEAGRMPLLLGRVDFNIVNFSILVAACGTFLRNKLRCIYYKFVMTMTYIFNVRISETL